MATTLGELIKLLIIFWFMSSLLALLSTGPIVGLVGLLVSSYILFLLVWVLIWFKLVVYTFKCLFELIIA